MIFIKTEKPFALTEKVCNYDVMKNMILTNIVLVVCFCLAGCARNTTRIITPEESTPGEKSFQAQWQASLDVLGKYDFNISRTDRREGAIYTHPMIGKTFGEFWRRDAVKFRDSLEGTLHKVYRSATVEIKPTTADADTYFANVIVRLTRSNKPGMQFTSSGEAIYLYAGGESTRSRLLVNENNSPVPLASSPSAQSAESDGYLTDLGRDHALENVIKARITAAANRSME